MCGIYGQFRPEGADPDLIERMAAALAHRGPDGYGTYHHGPVALGAGRLAIIDLAAGVQPIWNESHSAAVIYNGEIYNYRTLRLELESLGHHFATHTDTEVIIHGYESWGTEILTRLRGMFALAIWDEARQRLILARDRLGKKPLYYTRHNSEYVFASEIKALFERADLGRAVNSDALPHYLTLGFVPAPQTLFEGIYKVAPGTMMIIDAQGCTTERYWTPVADTSEPISFDDAASRIRQLLFEAVELRLISDVPIGAFLSGGVDSTTIVAIMQRLTGIPARTFTVGFDFDSGTRNDVKFNVDARYASLAAKHLGSEHHTITITDDIPLTTLFPQLVYAMDEPIVQPAMIQTVYVTALARTSGVPVLLSGDGADELFAGYPHDQADQALAQYLRIPSLLRSTLLTPILERLPARFDAPRKLAQKSRASTDTQRYLAWQRMIDPESLAPLLCDSTLTSRANAAVERVLSPLMSAPHVRHFAERMAFARMQLWLAEDSNMRMDKMSMLMSTESRAPFLDHKLVEQALRIPLEHKLRGGNFKAVLKAAISDLLPAEILTRPKWGFFQPSSQWLRSNLRPLVDEYLSPRRVEASGIFNPAEVSRLVEAHMSGEYHLWPLWTLLTFQLWHALYIEQSLTLSHRITPEEVISTARIIEGIPA